MQSLLRRASLVALLVGLNLVVRTRESAAAETGWQHCQWMRAWWGCYQGCVTFIFTSCGNDPCWLDYQTGCPE